VADATGRSWDDTRQVDWYLDRVGRLEPRRAGEQALAEVVPEAPDSLLDLGCGDGRLASLVLSMRPDLARAVCTDVSPAMIERARRRFADDGRVTVASHDLTMPIAPLGTFDLVVSGFAIHHLEHGRKRTLFAEIARQLRPGGVFANLEVVASATPERHQEFLRAIGRAADDPEDRLASVEDQVGWMATAGLRNVDCIWRWRGFALLVGEAGPDDPDGGDR
jgi:tRNA (cmo5U34)-methyltransferase